MHKHFTIVFGLIVSVNVLAADITVPVAPKAPAESMQGDAMKLCERLGGTERELCMKQARENQRAAGSPVAPPGAAPAKPQTGAAEAQGSGSGVR